MSIKIDLKIFLFGIIFWFTKQIELYALLMMLAIIHELGHLISGLCLQLKPYSIKITPLGVQILFKNYVQDYNIKVKNGNEICVKRIIIAAAGPIVNIFIALIAILISNNMCVNKETLVYANILLALFNLLPIYPLDGGRILKEIIIIIIKRKKRIIQNNKYNC